MDTLNKLRKKIDDIDGRIISQLGKRFAIVREIGGFKRANKLPIFDDSRWREVLECREKIGTKIGLPKKLVNKIWQIIHEHALIEESKK